MSEMKRPRGNQLQQRRVFRVNGKVAAFPVAISGEDMNLLVYGYAGPAGVRIEFAGIKKEQRDRSDMDKSPVFFQARQIHDFNSDPNTPISGKSVPFPYVGCIRSGVRTSLFPSIRCGARNPSA